ncbi:sulfotransferase family protein [Glycocaulis sp.]
MTDKPRFHEDARPVVVTGAPRSGTTFLTVAMNQHPQILLTNELRPWVFVNHVRLRSKTPSELLPEHPQREVFQRAMMGELYRFVDRFYRTRVPRTEMIVATGKPPSVDPQIRAYGDKNPSYADPKESWCAGMIAKHWPGVRFVHIHRDPRSCAASYKSVPVYSDEIAKVTQIWKRHIEAMDTLARSLDGEDRIMTIRYEDLVTERGLDIMRKLEGFLGLDPANEPADFLKKEMTRRTPYRSPATPDALLGQTSFDQRLTPDEIGYVEHECRSLMETLGYEPGLDPDAAATSARAIKKKSRASRAAKKAKRANVSGSTAKKVDT